MSSHEILLKSDGLLIMKQNTVLTECVMVQVFYMFRLNWRDGAIGNQICTFVPLHHPSHTLHPLPPLSFPAQECDEFVELNLSHALIGTSIRVRLLLYTNEKGTCGTLMSHADPFEHPNFNGSRPTTFLIHGYRPTGSPPMWLPNITKLLLARTDMNLIVVDWNYGATNVNYLKAVENTHAVADNLTAFVERLKVRV